MASLVAGVTTVMTNLDKARDLVLKYTSQDRPQKLEIGDLRRRIYRMQGRKQEDDGRLVNQFRFLAKLEKRYVATTCVYAFFVDPTFIGTFIMKGPVTIPAGTDSYESIFDVISPVVPSPLKSVPFRILCDGTASNSLVAQVSDDELENLDLDGLKKFHGVK
jgi:hypothetical protein